MNLSDRHCVPVASGSAAMSQTEESAFLGEISGWELSREGVHTLCKEITFPTYLEGADFVRAAAGIADSENHHPDLQLLYKRVIIRISTHAVKGLSLNDFILAAKFDLIQAKRR